MAKSPAAAKTRSPRERLASNTRYFRTFRTEAAMRAFKSDRSGDVPSLFVLIVATIAFAGGLAYEGKVLTPPQRTAQLALPDPNP
jgi:hypothetical protein